MFFFFHLVVGAVLGLVLERWRGDRHLFLAAVIGSAIPDVIDKPLGELIFADSIGYGRIFFHSLPLLCLIALSGLILYRSRRGLLLLAAAAGIALHQVFDTMWVEPANWFWPFLGPFVSDPDPMSLSARLLTEILNPLEWILFLVLIVLVFLVLKGGAGTAVRRYIRPFAVLLPLLLGIVAISAFLAGIHVLPVSITGLSRPAENLLLAEGAMIAAAFLAIRPPQGSSGP